MRFIMGTVNPDGKTSGNWTYSPPTYDEIDNDPIGSFLDQIAQQIEAGTWGGSDSAGSSEPTQSPTTQHSRPEYRSEERNWKINDNHFNPEDGWIKIGGSWMRLDE
jgi:hypothetical protein